MTIQWLTTCCKTSNFTCHKISMLQPLKRMLRIYHTEHQLSWITVVSATSHFANCQFANVSGCLGSIPLSVRQRLKVSLPTRILLLSNTHELYCYLESSVNDLNGHLFWLIKWTIFKLFSSVKSTVIYKYLNQKKPLSV